MKLRALAHSRTGDKGNISNISVIAFRDEDYPFICEHVTAERVKHHFREIVQGDVLRYDLPSISALNFVLKTRSEAVLHAPLHSMHTEKDSARLCSISTCPNEMFEPK